MAAAPLVLLALLASTPPSSGDVLREACRAGAQEPKHPWALAHGMVSEGRAFRARDGRLAADVFVSDFLDRATSRFGASTPEGLPGDAHPHLLVKTLLLSGYPPAHVFRTPHGPVSLQSLVDALVRDFQHDAALSPEGAWTLDALAHALPPDAVFTPARGGPVRLDALMDEALAFLEREQAELLAGMKAGQAVVPKRKQGLYAHPCGGLHLVQAVLTHARHARVRAAWGARLDTQVALLFYRLDSESRQYDAALAALAPSQRLPLLVQKLKFYGHWLETLGRYRDETGWTPSPTQLQALRHAGALLDGAVRRLDASGAWRSRESLKNTDRALYLDLIGDTCHAARGWRDWRNRLGG